MCGASCAGSSSSEGTCLVASSGYDSDGDRLSEWNSLYSYTDDGVLLTIETHGPGTSYRTTFGYDAQGNRASAEVG